MDSKKKSFVISSLRRASYRWPARTEAINKARISRGLYLCNACKKQVRAKDKVADHIYPVIDPCEGFVGFDKYIDRMYCDADGWQVLCSDCHTVKSKEENDIRKEMRYAVRTGSENKRKKR